ncbi:hypothetical protein F4781DRAFT_69755 [Annulohypoxylon bovei var. microspora]|nr:hypothetical protein F4781DRAFT_69755 [Annulohypoxylon bovei var. microspora]
MVPQPHTGGLPGPVLPQSKKTAQELVYTDAADILFRNPEAPAWWFDNDAAEAFLKTKDPATNFVLDKNAHKHARNIAVDVVRYNRDELKKSLCASWKDVRETRPVMFVASRPQANTHRLGPWVPTGTDLDLSYMLKQFFAELRPLIAPTWQPWVPYFSFQPVEDQLSLLESIPRPIPLMEAPTNLRLCIVAGLEDAYSEDTHDNVKRFVRILEQFFLADRRGKLLFLCRNTFDIKGMLHSDESVVDFKSGYEGDEAYTSSLSRVLQHGYSIPLR